MTIIDDVYGKIGRVLVELRPQIGTATFSAKTVVDAYVERYPGDVEVMEARRPEKPTSHSLRGYLDGMIYSCADKADGRDPEMPAIQFVSKMTYRFVR